MADVRFGIKTGANEFFYLEEIAPPGVAPGAGLAYVKNTGKKKDGTLWQGWIEAEFLKPVIKSPRECKRIIIKSDDLRYKIFMCHKTGNSTAGQRLLESH